MGERLEFSTSSVAPRRRLDLWRSSLSESFAPMEVRVNPTEHVDAKITTVPVDALSVMRLDVFPQEMVRPRSLMKSHHFNGYVLAFILTGVEGYSHNGVDNTTAIGEVVLYDYAYPFDVSVASEPYHVGGTSSKSGPCILAVSIPRAGFERVFDLAPKAAGLSLGPGQASTPIINGFFRTLMERGHLLDPATAARMAAIGLDLLAAGFAERLIREPTAGMGAATMVYRAKVIIEDRLNDARFDTAMLAAAMNLSVRRLQEVFAEQELTVDAYLWERRLSRARQQLRSPAFDGFPITTIAYDCGFASPSHFSTRYRQRFGMTPTEYRHHGRLEHGRREEVK